MSESDPPPPSEPSAPPPISGGGSDRAKTPPPVEDISANRRGFFRQILALGLEQAEKATRRFDDAMAAWVEAEGAASADRDPGMSSNGDDKASPKPPPLRLDPPPDTQPRSDSTPRE